MTMQRCLIPFTRSNVTAPVTGGRGLDVRSRPHGCDAKEDRGPGEVLPCVVALGLPVEEVPDQDARAADQRQDRPRLGMAVGRGVVVADRR